MSKRVVPYGSWPSPLSAARVTAGALRLDQIQLDGDDVYWIEGRASEGGRNVIVKRSASGHIEDVTPPEFNVRSRVHEYGGAAYTVDRGTVYFSNFADQRIYRQQKDRAPVAITDAGPCFADYRADISRDRLIAVREMHLAGSEAKNDIVAIGTPTGVPTVTLSEGADFYSDPIVSPDGKFLAWLQWHHPNMPWDGTELWVAAFNPDGKPGVREKVAGGAAESIFQPEWSPDNALYFVSDRTGWWNLYRWRGVDVESVHEMAAEFGKPQWTFSMSTYAFVTANRIAATYVQDGRWQLAMIDMDLHRFEPVALPLQPVESIKATSDAIYFIGASATEAPAIVELDPRSRRTSIIRSSATSPIARDWISVPEAVTFTAAGREVHAFYYPPANPEVEAPTGARPPMLVITHGGPTGATSDVLDPKIQFWTSRGFAVLDVNYSGSTGYGRPYRDRLKGQWGIVDVADVIDVAKEMVVLGKADADRLIIRGSSA
ncbi:MAG TPA: prolyl oligopeptidase family serine peptidase, partial [Vicinamibacterales bacterium]